VPQKLEQICDWVAAGKTGRFETSKPTIKVLLTILAPVEWAVWAYLRLRYGLRGRGIEKAPQMDRLFFVDSRCDGCAVCVRVCPVENVEIQEGRPVWQHRCEQCFACYEWCPREAIVARAGASKRRYNHPEVRLHDVIRRPA
jgi:ferredoxin